MDKYLVVWYYTTEESKKWTIRHTLKHTQNKEDKNYYLEIPFRQFKIAFKYIFPIFFFEIFLNQPAQTFFCFIRLQLKSNYVKWMYN